MSLTITLNPATLDALSAEATARNSTCEQVVSDVVENYFAPPQSPDPDYDAWFRSRIEKARKEIREGRFFTNEEVERRAALRREKLLARLSAQQ